MHYLMGGKGRGGMEIYGSMEGGLNENDRAKK